MSVSRVQFLKSLGGSMAGLAAGAGLASAAQALLAKMPRGMTEESVTAENTPVPAAPVKFVQSGPDSGRRIALTFDDGPTPGVTDAILEELKLRNLSATFFMIGRQVAAAPELARQVFAEGHEVGNHTFHHVKLTTLPDERVDEEIQKTQEIIAEAVQHRPVWLRPPFGALRKDQAAIPFAKNLGVALWSVDSRDWAQPGENQIVDTILTRTQPGSIILCHDLYPQTIHCLGQVMDRLLEKQFEFVTLSTLVQEGTSQTI